MKILIWASLGWLKTVLTSVLTLAYLCALRDSDVGWILVSRWHGVGARGSRELIGESSFDPSIDADLEELADLIISRQGRDVESGACGSAPAALAALLGEQVASPVSEPFEDVQMALHDAINTCVCDGHITVMDVSELLDGSGLVEAIIYCGDCGAGCRFNSTFFLMGDSGGKKRGCRLQPRKQSVAKSTHATTNHKPFAVSALATLTPLLSWTRPNLFFN